MKTTAVVVLIVGLLVSFAYGIFSIFMWNKLSTAGYLVGGLSIVTAVSLEGLRPILCKSAAERRDLAEAAAKAAVRRVKVIGPRFLAVFVGVGLPWTVFFLLWGGIGGLVYSGFLLCALFQRRGYTWIGSGPGGSEEAARRNARDDESERTQLQWMFFPTLTWVLISIVLSCSLTFQGYAKWPPF